MDKSPIESASAQENPASGNKPKCPKPERPVAWLLGRQLLGSLKGILLYVAYGKNLDARDWMWADVFPARDKMKALKVWRKLHERKLVDSQEAATANPYDIVEEREKEYWQDEKNEFWFDFIADTGDGTKATYSIAYLCLSDLYVPTRCHKKLKANDKVRTCRTKEATTTEVLPRGEFLLIGGDTAYHVADYMTLSSRVQSPFQCAYEDVIEDRKACGEDPLKVEKDPNRPLFGIPGNHDYYDQLNGFRRQFHVSVRSEPTHGQLPKTDDPEKLADQPQLYLPGFNRYQQASYIALQLPFNWWLWGLDTEVGQIDERQRKFFRDLWDDPNPDNKIEKLIVATCSPTTVFGKLADPKKDEKAADAFRQLGLSQPFLPNEGTNDLNTAGDEKLMPGQCRLDISGDVHHYARYWGPKPTTAPQDGPVRKRAAKPGDVPTAESYASVVSGIGGAFHHPSETYIDEVQEQVLYPSETKSTEKVAQRIFNPWRIFRGGNIGSAGFIIAFTIYFAATVTPSSWSFINDLYLAGWDKMLKGVGDLRLVPLLLSSIPLLLPFVPGISKKLFKREQGGSIATDAKSQSNSKKSQYIDNEIKAEPERQLWAIFVASLLMLAGGFLLLGGDRPSIVPFGNSLIILLSIVWAAAAIALSMRYSDFLLKKAHRKTIQWHDWVLTGALTITGLLSIAVGLWFFGKNSVPAYLISDLVFMLVVIGVFVALILLPVFAGGELFQPKRNSVGEPLGIGRKLLRALFGLWHAILQLGVAFLLTRQVMVSPPAAAALILITLLLASAMMWWIGSSLLKAGRREMLAFVWVIYGVAMLGLPWLVGKLGLRSESLFPIEEWSGWQGLLPPLLAGGIGFVMACVWFGWYLGVCFAFNGHNNEVGGACQIEEFKQFIRFRLTADGLTGYVIAVDEPRYHDDRQQLDPKIIDVFHLRVKQADGASVSSGNGPALS